jgi:integrase
MAALPLIQPIAGLLDLWRPKCPLTNEGWIFPNERSKPREFRDFTQQVMRPAVQAKGLVWKGLYAGRRGAGTMLVELTGNLVAAQELLRHKSMTTTALSYKKKTQSALANGMKLLEAAATK